MKNIINNISTSNPPNWGELYNWEWFRIHHFNTLKEHYLAIEKQQDEIPFEKAYPREEIKIFLTHLDVLINMINCLPNTRKGQGMMKEVRSSRIAYEKAYLNTQNNDASYWAAQEIMVQVFEVYDYMSSMCKVCK